MDSLSKLNEALAGRYEIEREIGAGGMATVYLAHDVKHRRRVALKVLKPELSAAVGAERFLREISIAAQLSHPNVLTLIDSGDAGGRLYYVMPFVEGESLRSKIARDGALPASDAARILREVVDALVHAHRRGMVHRDIKPDNVMISERHAQVLDFGVAKAMSEAAGHQTLTAVGMSLGTPAYMAPEQVAAEPDVDQRADIYAVGILAYEMLAGRPPFVGPTQQVLSAQLVATPEPISTLAPSCPPELARVVTKCLEKDPRDRYQSADALLTDLEALSTPIGTPTPGLQTSRKSLRSRVLALGTLAAVLVIGGAIYGLTARERRQRWVREEAVPRIQKFIESGSNDSAFAIAMEAAKANPADSVLNSLWPKFSRKSVLRTEPEGARVFRTLFADTSNWDLVGSTPTDSVRLPFAPSVTRIRIEKAGFRTVDRLIGGFPSAPLRLDAASGPYPDMVRVMGGEFTGNLPGLDNLKTIHLGDYLIERHEITNRQFKAFVDAGGYSNPRYWDFPIVSGGKELTVEAALPLFRDKTGRPGPSTWEAGDFPQGQSDYPVGGVSWYEAAAYAKFAGKSLPTLYHWGRAATIGLSAYIVPGSNFGGQGPAPATGSRGMTGWGVFDMAGNVREWCFNASGTSRYILGGGWSDPTYLFDDAYTQDPLDRSAINGIRLVKYLSDEPNLKLAMQPVTKSYRNYAVEKPVSDATYQTFLRMYDYDRTPLEAKIETVDSSGEFAISERISFNAAYSNERMIAYLYLPKKGRPPYQTVVYFPGSNAIHTKTTAGLELPRLDFFLKSGRAVIYPIYKGTYERGDSLKSDYGDESIFYRDHVLMWAKDLRRSVDYLETRQDIDATKLAYFGASWGAYLGGIMATVEPRIKVAVLYIAGLAMERTRPEVDVLNFLPRLKIPVIMLNGKYDHFFPTETAQKPFFRLLGSPPDKKRYVVYEGGHFIPRTQLIAESLAWLDKYLGPVK